MVSIRLNAGGSRRVDRRAVLTQSRHTSWICTSHAVGPFAPCVPEQPVVCLHRSAWKADASSWSACISSGALRLHPGRWSNGDSSSPRSMSNLKFDCRFSLLRFHATGCKILIRNATCRHIRLLWRNEREHFSKDLLSLPQSKRRNRRRLHTLWRVAGGKPNPGCCDTRKYCWSVVRASSASGIVYRYGPDT